MTGSLDARASYARQDLDWRAKGLPLVDGSMAADAVRDAGWNLFDGHFLLPTMVILEEALGHDIALMADFARGRGISLAPHGKTTMCPQIWHRQLDAGAWAVTVATAWQAAVAVSVGVRRILIANEIVDEAGIAWLSRTLDDDASEVICQVDSIASVQRLASLLGSPRRRLQVLIEVGFQGGRTGIRNVHEAASILHAIAAAPALQAVGATAFEGIVGGDTAATRRDRVRELMANVRAVGAMAAEAAAESEDPGLDEVILSAGGSTYFLEVADRLTPPLAASVPVRVVLRSGCTVTHDHGGYELTSPWGSRASGGTPRLRAALEVWAPVISRPEPGAAFAAAGRRDLPYDLGLPTPLKVRGLEGAVRSASGISVTGLNDQHAYLSLDAETELKVGESIGFGIAHPCSAFDRWRFIPVVNQSYDVIDVYETIF